MILRRQRRRNRFQWFGDAVARGLQDGMRKEAAMHVLVKITFQTTHALQQETGMKMWEMGTHFMAMGGRATYQLTTSGTADDLTEAIEGAVAAITLVVEKDHPRQGIRVIKVMAEELVEVMAEELVKP